MAMDALKPAVRDTLEFLAQGRMIVSMGRRRDVGYLEELDGRKTSERMIVPGVGTLFRLGYIDEFCVVTSQGRAALSSSPTP